MTAKMKSDSTLGRYRHCELPRASPLPNSPPSASANIA